MHRDDAVRRIQLLGEFLNATLLVPEALLQGLHYPTNLMARRDCPMKFRSANAFADFRAVP